MPVDPKRGEIWMVSLEPVVGQELNSHGFTRPCIVISSDSIRVRAIRTVIPLSSWRERHSGDPLRIPVVKTSTNGLDNDSSADSTQVRTIALERFDYRRGMVTADELEAIVYAVGVVIEHP